MQIVTTAQDRKPLIEHINSALAIRGAFNIQYVEADETLMIPVSDECSNEEGFRFLLKFEDNSVSLCHVSTQHRKKDDESGYDAHTITTVMATIGYELFLTNEEIDVHPGTKWVWCLDPLAVIAFHCEQFDTFMMFLMTAAKKRVERIESFF